MSEEEPLVRIEFASRLQGTTGSGTVYRLASVFAEVLETVYAKEQGYGGAWRQQGWMGNLARVLSKSSRLKNLLWAEKQWEIWHSESCEETALDMIALAAMFVDNLREQNKWGQP